MPTYKVPISNPYCFQVKTSCGMETGNEIKIYKSNRLILQSILAINKRFFIVLHVQAHVPWVVLDFSLLRHWNHTEDPHSYMGRKEGHSSKH